MSSITRIGRSSALDGGSHPALSLAPEKQDDMRQFMHELQRMQAQLPESEDSEADEEGEDEGKAPG